MGKIGCITLNGRKVFSVGRGIVSARGDLVIFSDGSSINLKTGVVTNLSPELLLSLDEIPGIRCLKCRNLQRKDFKAAFSVWWILSAR